MPKPIVEITKEITFEAAHYLHNPKWDRAKNLDVFKKCSGYRHDDPKAIYYPHGHSYRLRVTVKATPHPETGFVMDFKALKTVLEANIFNEFDHRFINKEVEPFKDNPNFQTTVENLLLVMWASIKLALQKEKVILSEISLWETPTSFATYRGEKK
ncbi:MAG TPA: 6-carboxytetrahydropterin synthase [bacterium]|jgi:6-pyruvoyltetrahydropterin/6-carboxytetrahydropterin synthase|nr:6-carboxytetrahydropterin synthase [bacterium]